jgi:hypothetical protein
MRQLWNFLPALFLISNGCDCGGETDITFSCPLSEECFIHYGDENIEQNIITGDRLFYYEQDVCSFGKTVCNQETESITCEGIKYPEKEICDGVDNDCNGEIDDGEHLSVSRFNHQNPCKETEQGVCKDSRAQCILGEWICLPPDNLYGQEICDGKDNDCDGDIDEDIEEEYIYTGPPETLNVGECRAGIKRCENGVLQNFGMVTPINEICGNDDDDDCDGWTDEMETEPESYDFALILDVSGSMYQYLYSLNVALCDWSNTSRFNNSRFAIIGIAMRPDMGNEYGIGLITDFVDSSQACNVLNGFLGNPGVTTAEEYQMDAVLKSMTVGDHIELSWSDTRERKVVMFSDETPQWVYETDENGYILPTLQDKMGEIINACTTTNTTVSIFSPWGAHWNIIWDDIVSYCGGYLEYLVLDAQEMIERLNYWFGEEC